MSEQQELVEKEYFDVYDKDGNKTGKTKGRKAVHRDGDWHKSVQIWVLDKDQKKAIVQKRVETKDSWAGYWDVSCAGHLSAGDSIMEGALREIEEELGLTLSEEEIKHVYTFKDSSVQQNGAFINNEHVEVFVVHLVPNLDDLVLQEEEVAEVKWMDITEIFEAMKEDGNDFVPFESDKERKHILNLLLSECE